MLCFSCSGVGETGGCRTRERSRLEEGASEVGGVMTCARQVAETPQY